MDEQLDVKNNPQYKTIGYSQTINTGNYENRKYSFEIEPNGASFIEAIEMMERDIQQREQMYKKEEALSEKIDRGEAKVDALKGYITSAKSEFDKLQTLLSEEENEGDEGIPSLESDQSWSKFKRNLCDIERKFGDLYRTLEINEQAEEDDDDIPW